jgi:hypothetical protein
MIPAGVINERKIAADVRAVAKQLAPDVVRIRYDVGSDWAGDQSISFRIVLSDRASREDRLGDVTNRIERILLGRVKPTELGLQAYLDFRSESEAASLREVSWA